AKRVVCLSASGLDVLSELRLEPVGALRSAVASQSEFYGDRSHQWPRVGSCFLPNFQMICQLQPDLILG
ncbi:MAG: iron-siderophore ABC transporter substrate-binding protein, partial [Cyanobacteria bacterium P01_H01_bin.152]